MKQYFDTKEEAEQYREKHELYARTVEFIPYLDKYVLNFNIKAKVERRIL